MTDNALIVAPRRNHNDLVDQNQAIVDLKQRVFQSGIHFGEPFKGAGKPVLLKPGAEMLCSLFGLRPRFNAITVVEQWEPPLFHYRYECELISIETGQIVGAGIGSCNSMEDKYRWRKSERTCPKCGAENIRKSNKDDGWYCWAKTGGCGAQFKGNDPAIVDQHVGKVPNEDIYTQVNTIDKMAQKRALLAATLVATGASAYFTQDVEDFPGAVIEGEVTEHSTPSAPPAPAAPKPAPEPPAQPRSYERVTDDDYAPHDETEFPIAPAWVKDDVVVDNIGVYNAVVDRVIVTYDMGEKENKSVRIHAGMRIWKAAGFSEPKIIFPKLFAEQLTVGQILTFVQVHVNKQDREDEAHARYDNEHMSTALGTESLSRD